MVQGALVPMVQGNGHEVEPNGPAPMVDDIGHVLEQGALVPMVEGNGPEVEPNIVAHMVGLWSSLVRTHTVP
ncbi:MAG: hypothetical protein CMJ95_10700 [Planctomycetes bacterium]|nr:hypothetical protein [Planctomycetota bacterium]